MVLEIKKLLELVGIHTPDELPTEPAQNGANPPDPTSESSRALDTLKALISGGTLRHHGDTAAHMVDALAGLSGGSYPLDRKALLRGILVGAVASATTIKGITLKAGLKTLLNALDNPAAATNTEKIIPFSLIHGVETNHLIKLYGRFTESVHVLENYLAGLVNGNLATDFKQAIAFLNERLDVREVLLKGEDPIAFATKPPPPVVIPVIDIPDTLSFVPNVHPDFKPLEFTLSRQGRSMKVIIERVDFDTALALIPERHDHELRDNAHIHLPPHLEPFILLVRALDGTVEGLVVSHIVKSADDKASMSCDRWIKFDRNKNTSIADMGMAMLVAQLHYMDTKGYLNDTIINGYLQPALHNIKLFLLNKYRKEWNSPVEPRHPGIMMSQPVDGISAEEGRFYLEKSGLAFTEIVLATPAVLEKAANYLGIVETQKGISWDPETQINTTHLVTQLQLDTKLKLSFTRCELDALALASSLLRSGHTDVKILEISAAPANLSPYISDENLWHFFSVWQNNASQAIKYTGGVHYAVMVDNQVYDLQSRLRSPLPFETYLSLSFPDQELKTKTYLPNELRQKLRTSRRYHWARHDGFQKFPSLIHDAMEPKPAEPVAVFEILRDVIAAGRKKAAQAAAIAAGNNTTDDEPINNEPLAQLVLLDNETPSHHFPSYMITGAYENNLDSLIPPDGTPKRFWITPSNIMPIVRFVDSPPATKLNFYDSMPKNKPEKFAVIDVYRASDGAVEVAIVEQQNMSLPIGKVKEQFNTEATTLDRAAVIERLRTGRKDFSGFRLSGADLSHLDLRGARFTDTLMDETNMKGARVDRLGLMDIIEGCTRVEDSHYVYIIANTMAGVDFSGADLSGLDLSGTIFHDANFIGCNLTHTNLAKCDLSNAIFDYEGIQTIVEGGSRKDENGRNQLVHINLNMDFIWDSPEKLLNFLEQKVDFGSINLAISYQKAKMSHPVLKDSSLKQQFEIIIQKLLWVDVMHERYTSLREGRRNNVEAILPTLAAFLKGYLNFFSLKETTQLMRIYPSANVRMIEEMRELAIEISRLMDSSERSSFRETIHNYPSPTNLILIEEYIQKATQDPSKKEASEKLLEIQKLAEIIYGGAPDLELIKNLEKIGLSVSADDFKKPDRLGKLAITLRQMYKEGKNFRYPIARALLAIDYSLFVLGYPTAAELYAPAQAVKIASLLKGIYGLGYGSVATLRLADSFDQLSKQDLDPADRKRAYELFGIVALHVINEATASFHQMYDPLIASQGDLWEIPQEAQSRFANNLYRTSCLYQLNLHLQQMGIALPNSDIPQKILALMAQNVEARDFQSYFYDSDTFNADDKNFMGGKGWGLKVLAYIKKTFNAPFEVPHGFALPPLLLDVDEHLLPEQQEIILDSLRALEQKTGKSFMDGTLKVSVRSGALISMPGAMDTVLNVTSANDVLKYVERVYKSWNNPAAREMRLKNGIPDDWGTAVNIVEMIDATADEKSGAGVFFSSGLNESGATIFYGHQKPGTVVVNGEMEKSDPMLPEVEQAIVTATHFLENILRYPLDIEFTVRSGLLHLLQIRPANLNNDENLAWVKSRMQSGLINHREAVILMGGLDKLESLKNIVRVEPRATDLPLAEAGLAAGTPLTGVVATTLAKIREYAQMGKKVIFATNKPNAAYSVADMLNASAVIFTGGNPLSHLVNDANMMGLSYLGQLPMQVREEAIEVGDQIIAEGETLTLDPENRLLYAGTLPVKEEPHPETAFIDNLMTSTLLPIPAMALPPIMAYAL